MPLPDPCDVLAADDPVRAFGEAHAQGRRIVLRSSGTTHQPRLVLRTTASWTDSFDAVSSLSGMSAASCVWIPGPVTATMNLFARVHADALGAGLVDEPVNATHAVLTPLALSRALDHDLLGAGQVVVSSGDGVTRALVARARERGVVLHHYYGASELSFVAWSQPDEPLVPFPDVECVVVDGCIWARSPYLSEGYAPGSPPGPFVRRDDGFASVQDRGELRNGALVVHGRGDLAITTAGVTVDVADVEQQLRAAATGTVLVVGVPDERLGAIVVGVLTEADDLPAVRARARALDPAHRPHRWHVLPEIPVTAAGKPDRERIVELVSGGPTEPGRG